MSLGSLVVKGILCLTRGDTQPMVLCLHAPGTLIPILIVTSCPGADPGAPDDTDDDQSEAGDEEMVE